MLFIRQIPRYVGDALSILRALAVIPFNFTLVAEAWTSAFLILGFAWATDLLDGVAVRKWGGLSDRYPNLDLDGISDTVLQIGSTAGIAYYTGSQCGFESWQFLAVGITATACAMWGGIMMLLITLKGETPVTRAHRLVVGSYMIVGRGVLQIGVPLVWLAYTTEGLDQVIAMVIVLLCIAGLQYQKVLLWWNGRLRAAK